jgi:hypothetical protein
LSAKNDILSLGRALRRYKPQAIIDRLDAAVVDALAGPRARQRLVDLGQDIYPRAQQTPAALRTLHQADVDKWWPIVKAANSKTN